MSLPRRTQFAYAGKLYDSISDEKSDRERALASNIHSVAPSSSQVHTYEAEIAILRRELQRNEFLLRQTETEIAHLEKHTVQQSSHTNEDGFEQTRALRKEARIRAFCAVDRNGFMLCPWYVTSIYPPALCFEYIALGTDCVVGGAHTHLERRPQAFSTVVAPTRRLYLKNHSLVKESVLHSLILPLVWTPR